MLRPHNPKTPEDRIRIFEFLIEQGYVVPDYGTVAELKKRHTDTKQCIVYTDSGSEMMNLFRAPDDYFASMHVGKHGKSVKLIQIGSKCYWCDFFSNNNWRSTKGHSKSILRSVGNEYHNKINLPMFSIDFIESDLFYAIDFDIYPSIKNTSIIKILSLPEVVSLIKDGINHYECASDKICESSNEVHLGRREKIHNLETIVDSPGRISV